ncbi:MAG: hypothetical protein E4H27_07135, partial [Anaerolineales bacterium]
MRPKTHIMRYLNVRQAYASKTSHLSTASSGVVEHIEVFEVFTALKRLVSVILSLSLGAEQLGMRPGSEAMML